MSVATSAATNVGIRPLKRKYEIEDDDEEATKRYKIAMQRWAILREAILGAKSIDTCKSIVSVRRFASYGLLSTKLLSTTVKEETWHMYTCSDYPEFGMKIKHLTGKITANTLNGFNNTGNVCVWPSEEVMTYFCMKHFELFRDKRVIELGGGMTCLAGVAVAIHSKAKSVVLTDGNEESISNLDDILNEKENSSSFGDTKVSSRVLRWGEGELDNSLKGSFDVILCADCLFFDEGRQDLVDLVRDLLSPDGMCYMFAPQRGKTFNQFVSIAKTSFQTSVEENYDQKVYGLHCKMKNLGLEHYDENIHFPLQLTLHKSPKS